MSFLRKNSLTFGLVAILMFVVLLAACGTPAEPTEAPAEVTEQEEPAVEQEEPAAEQEEPAEEAAAPTGEPIVFGMVAPMTGDAAEYGTQLESGVRLAIDEINANGGIDGRPVELEICDDKCDPYEASMCAQRMVASDDIFAVIGHVCSSCTLAGGPIYEEAGLTVMT
ncbi:MAG: ABC transporter substrate-binding protein, partial [Anaerolineales bacterium]|nr:ABC transporter substrate-binding protein [Anaerolineales bacterium]